MADGEGLRRTFALYCQLCDDGRFDEWITLFTDDARFSVLDKTHEGQAAIKAFMEVAQAPERRGKHFMGQSVFEEHGDGSTVTAVSDYMFIARTADGGYAMTSAGRYHDELVRGDDGQWRFRSREIRFLGS